MFYNFLFPADIFKSKMFITLNDINANIYIIKCVKYSLKYMLISPAYDIIWI